MEINKKAISLQYDRNTDSAPKISSKGKGELAKKILEIARSNNIPIYEDEILTEILDKIDIGSEIPEFLFEIVAEIYSFTYKLMRENENIFYDKN